MLTKVTKTKSNLMVVTIFFNIFVTLISKTLFKLQPLLLCV